MIIGLWNVVLNLELNQNSEKKTSNKNQEFFDSGQKLETAQVPIDRWIVKQNGVRNIQWNKTEISAHVKKEVLINITARMNLENVMQREIS